MAPLQVSVVISTRDRPRGLQRLLDALRAQSLPAERFEVLVVDDGSSTDATTALLEDEQRTGELRLRAARHPQARGQAAGRNAWRMASAPLIAFTDDDCIPDPDWLAVGVDAAAAKPGAIVQGRTLPSPSELALTDLLVRTQRIEALGPQFQTCNIFYPRELLERLGGFEESFGVDPAGEDTDLAWRALESGAQAVFAPDALVRHEVAHLGVRGTLRLARRWGGAVRIFSAHPPTRSMLYRGVFWNVYHYLMWRSLLSLLGPAWLRRMLLARHLLELRRRARDGGASAWGVPFLIAHDAVECWSVARGALRHRTLVL